MTRSLKVISSDANYQRLIMVDMPEQNPIIRTARNKDVRGLSRISGFIGESTDDNVTIYPDFELRTALELSTEDILEIVEGKDSTQRTTVYLPKSATITIRTEISAEELTTPEASWPWFGPEMMALARAPTDDEPGLSVPDWLCMIHRDVQETMCSIKHHDNPLMYFLCMENAAVEERLCRFAPPLGDIFR